MTFPRTSLDDVTSEWAHLQTAETRSHSPTPRSSVSINLSPTTPTTTPAKSPRQIISELTIEVLPALLISVGGSILAGFIMGVIQKQPAFDRVPALFIMVPILLNLKSNIELNMSTRLSTQANLGTFDHKKEKVAVMRSNMELLLLQSTIIGASVGLLSSVLSLIPSSGPTLGVWRFAEQSVLLLAAGLGCTLLGSAIIGVLICGTVSISHVLGIDPDNIGTPLASSFGDMSTLLILSLVSSVLIRQISTLWPLLTVALALALMALLFRVVRSNEHMAHHVGEGWIPLLYAAATSSIAGIIVEKCADRYPALPALVPVMNGIGGNIGTVFASRLSTSLHRASRHNPHAFSASEHNLVMCILLFINLPVQLGFLAVHRVTDTQLQVTLGFVLVYVAATIIHGLAMLLLGRLACTLLWSKGYDPDDYVNPFITGTGDMLGTVLLAIVFLIV
ncbi:hypothetical protein IWW39_005277 [Coemansia spiralis]|uniref:SLC41A/MgtE integral membrane domain-containing protein n=2 Tax=Coemansia TaxID=4863 RepID=A0A9W8GBB0_9FUNG|nr:hypothetical protein IWW39_005277 [Coemansia spiralis]